MTSRTLQTVLNPHIASPVKVCTSRTGEFSGGLSTYRDVSNLVIKKSASQKFGTPCVIVASIYNIMCL